MTQKIGRIRRPPEIAHATSQTSRAKMCLILLSYEPQNNNRLVVLSNRDEFYNRSSERAHYWSVQEIRSAVSSTDKDDDDDDDDEKPSATILAGRDSVGGGTWLGIDPKRNRFAAVTNFRMGMGTCLPRSSVVVNKKSNNQSQSRSRKRSRGGLPIDFLASDMDSMAFLRQSHIADGNNYGGFNMLVFDGKTLAYASNRKLDEVGGGRPRELTGGIYGLCNGLLDDPWPKVVKGKELLKAKLSEHELISSDNNKDSAGISSLLDIMQDTERPPDDLLPDTGIPIELERGYSSIFVHVPSIDYGTRSSGLVIMDGDGVQLFAEREYTRRRGEEGGEESEYETDTVIFRNFA